MRHIHLKEAVFCAGPARVAVLTAGISNVPVARSPTAGAAARC